MHKKSIFFFFSLAICFLLAGCESGSESEAEENVLEINIAHGNQPEEPIGQMAEKWSELVEEESNGEVKLNIYPSSQLGSEKDVVEQAIMGNNVIIFTGYDFLMDYVPDAGIFTAPFLTEDIDSLLRLTESDWFNSLEEDLHDKGIEIINTTTVYGERQLMTNKLIESPQDLKGLKIRVPNNRMYIQTFEAFGASPTPMPLSDTYTSLQQGLIDGAENPLPVLEGSNTNEVTNYLTLTGHTRIISPWIAGSDFIESLPPEVTSMLKETGLEAAEYSQSILEEEEEEVLQNFEDQGIEINEIDHKEFEEEAESVYEAFPEWSDGLYETVSEIIEKQND